MTPTEHAELSAAVARAIGWEVVILWKRVDIYDPHVTVRMHGAYGGQAFDYRDSRVCLGLLKWLIKNDCDVCERDGKPAIFLGFMEGLECSYEYFVGDTLELAVAQAVLAVAGKEKA